MNTLFKFLITTVVNLLIGLSLSVSVAFAAPLCASVNSRPAPVEKALFLDNEVDVASMRLHFLQKEMKEVRAAYYQLDGNKTGGILFSELIAAAKRGAKVRLILDSWNPEDWIDQRVKPQMYKALMEGGVEIRIFNPVDPSSITTYFNPNNFTRMHDKLLILSGQEVVTTGDRNIQNSNFRIQKRKGMKDLSYRSVEVVVQSRNMIEQTEAYFDKMWELAEPPDVSRVTDFELETAKKGLNNIFKIIRSKDFTNVDWSSRLRKVDGIDFLHDVPGEKGITPGIAHGIVEILKTAQKSITIYSPYTYVTPIFMTAIKDALQRKVKVRLVLPSWKSIDTPFTMQHFEAQAKELQAMGIQILQHNGSDFMHAKMAIVDGEKVFIGSFNFNQRSEKTDYETGFVVKAIEEPEFSRDVVEFDRQFQAVESAPFTPSKKTMLESLKIIFLRLMTRLIPFIRHQI